MTPRPSIVGNLAASRLLAHPWRRRAIVAVLLIVFGLLALFPRQYRAAVTLTPTDPASLGLGGALGQLGAFSNVFGNQAAVEISLKVARSTDVRRKVIRSLDLVRKRDFADEDAADRWLTDEVEIRALRGGIVQMQVKLGDAVLARTLVGAMADATRERLAEISRRQTAYKREVLVNLVRTSGDRFDRAQAAYDAFRRRTRYAQPGSSINAIGERVPAIQAELKAKEVQLRAARAFATDDNMSVRTLLAEMAALRSQLSEAENLDSGDPDSVNRVVVQSTQVINLERELAIARGLYEGYRRYLEGTAVEDMASSGNVRVLEPPYVDSKRQFRTAPAGLFIAVLLAWLAMEFYLLRPPVGDPGRDLRPRS